MNIDIIWPDYDDTDEDRHAADGIPETPDERRARKKAEAITNAAQEKLAARQVADPTSTQGTTSYAEGHHPDELAVPAEKERPLAALEAELGAQFSAPGDTKPAQPTRSLICRNPDCPNTGQHIAITNDIIQPIRCGGCSTVLHCDHQTERTITTEGTFAAPVEITIDKCTKCGTTVAMTKTNLPPIRLEDLPATLLTTLSDTP